MQLLKPLALWLVKHTLKEKIEKERIEKEDRKIRENCRKEGIKEGMNKGVSKARFEIAKEMIKQKIDINKICKCTKISKKEVEKIKEELKEA